MQVWIVKTRSCSEAALSRVYCSWEVSQTKPGRDVPDAQEPDGFAGEIILDCNETKTEL
jgi:hypothetical protein